MAAPTDVGAKLEATVKASQATRDLAAKLKEAYRKVQEKRALGNTSPNPRRPLTGVDMNVSNIPHSWSASADSRPSDVAHPGVQRPKDRATPPRRHDNHEDVPRLSSSAASITGHSLPEDDVITRWLTTSDSDNSSDEEPGKRTSVWRNRGGNPMTANAWTALIETYHRTRDLRRVWIDGIPNAPGRPGHEDTAQAPADSSDADALAAAASVSSQDAEGSVQVYALPIASLRLEDLLSDEVL